MDMGNMAGMDMGMGASGSNSTSSDSSSMSMNSSGMMMMKFHVGGGDYLWTSNFAPTTAPGIWGACVLLFFLALASRWLHAMERSLQAYWHERAFRKVIQRAGSAGAAHTAGRDPPWEPSCDVPRGLFQVVHSGILYLLMLAVM
jgi:Ctr copper transporter family